MQVKLIFENEDFLVLDKPSGLVVNRSETHSGKTLQDYIEDINLSINSLEEESEFKSRSGIVHRLDKDTSGIILIAKNPESFKYLQEKFKSREVQKKYLCLVLGQVGEDRFEIDAPISRNPNNRFKYAVVREGKEAQTYFEKISSIKIEDQTLTFLYAFPRTGRTHQIRVHLAAYGTPVIVDPIYMSEKDKEIATKIGIFRLMLHAKSLKFDYNGEEYFFESDTPEEFSKFLD
jgi:23S rRNA pseudouridine1911/1915/1917 synthase